MSNEKRKTIGRQLNTQASMVEMTDTQRSQVFTLKTGRKVTFRFVRVPASDVESKTFVNQETNGRDQLALTRESLKSIIQTIKFQQFFPCIGIQQGERIEILDGSRRRASAIYIRTGLDVMVTAELLSADEARHLAKDIQTAKEHNLREIGLRLIAPPPKEKSVISALWTFDEKDKFARKRVKGRTLTYEFSRMSKVVQDELDKAINEVLDRNLSQ